MTWPFLVKVRHRNIAICLCACVSCVHRCARGHRLPARGLSPDLHGVCQLISDMSWSDISWGSLSHAERGWWELMGAAERLRRRRRKRRGCGGIQTVANEDVSSATRCYGTWGGRQKWRRRMDELLWQRGCNVRAETSDLTPWLPCIANLNIKAYQSLQLQQWVQQKKRK